MKSALKVLVTMSFFILSILIIGTVEKLDNKGINFLENKKTEESNVAVNKDEEKYNLPLVVINTNGKRISENEKINGTIKIYDNKDGVNYLSDIPQLESDINIKIRGNTTRKLPKKQYSIELVNKNGKEVKEEVLGMPKSSEWILNASFEDKSLMRNYLAYNISRKIMSYAPRIKYCEVFLIDDNSKSLNKSNYKGVYMMVEKIDRDKNRVNISKTKKNLNTTSFIVLRNPNKDKDIILNNYGYDIYLYDYPEIIDYPKKNLTDEKKNYINKEISEFERVLYSNKFNDPIEGYRKYIDVESFVDYYLINEFFRNTDAGIFSTYIHKDFNGKIKAGPVWDFDTSMGNNSVISKYGDSTGLYMAQTAWFDRLLLDKTFVWQVLQRYKLLRKTYFSDQYLLNSIDDALKELGDAPKRNFQTWPIYMANQPEMFKNYKNDFTPYEHDINLLDEYLKSHPELLLPEDDRATSYEEEIKMLKKFIVDRGKWMDENIDSLYKWAD